MTFLNLYIDGKHVAAEGERLPLIGYFGAALIFVAILAVEALPPLWERRRIHMPRTTN